jgi:hypothetical protein
VSPNTFTFILYVVFPSTFDVIIPVGNTEEIIPIIPLLQDTSCPTTFTDILFEPIETDTLPCEAIILCPTISS